MKKCLLPFFVVACNISMLAQWTSLTTPTTGNYESIQFFDTNHGVASCTGNVIWTSNGGQSWDMTIIPGIRDISFVNQNVGWSAGISVESVGKTTDGGASWNTYEAPTTNSLWAVSAVSNNLAFVSGTGGVIYKTADGGMSFSVLDIDVSAVIADLHFMDEFTGIALQQTQNIWKTTNGGVTWTVVYNTSGVIFTDMYFLDDMTGFASGTNGTIVKTTDGGDTWEALTTGSTAALQYVHFYDENFGISAGFAGKVIRTTNGGATWISEDTGISGNLTSCVMLSPSSAIAAGQSGVMIKNNNLSTGVEEVSASANITVYPNPAIASVTMSSDRYFNHLSMTIRDLSGRIVRQINNLQGRSFVIDCGELPSGCYSIQLHEGDEYVASEKLILQD